MIVDRQHTAIFHRDLSLNYRTTIRKATTLPPARANKIINVKASAHHKLANMFR